MKQIRDYTLGEIKSICENHPDSCSGCPVINWCNKLSDESFYPYKWKLTNSPDWTDRDIEDARYICRVFGYDVEVRRSAMSKLLFIHTGRQLIQIDENLLPNIEPGQSVMLSEIIESESD